MTRAGVALALASCALRAAEPGPAPAELRTPELSVENPPGGSLVRVRVPGRIVAWTVARSPSGSRVVVLSDPTAQALPSDDPTEPTFGEPRPLPPCPERAGDLPMALHAVDVARPSAIASLREVPAGALDVDSADVDGDGTDEIVVTSPGRMSVLAEDGTLTTLFEHAGLYAGSVHPVAVDAPSLARVPRFVVNGWGSIDLVGRRADGTWGVLASAEVPLRGTVSPRTVSASNAVPRHVGTAEDGTTILATRPEQIDPVRLHTRLVRLHPGGGSSSEDSWARLPEPERLTSWAHLLLDDRPVLVAITIPADKLSLFGDTRLRLFPLEPDRSRLGRKALLATSTAATLMQDPKPWLLDADGDGDRDLVVAYHKGLIGSEIALEVFLRGDGTTFDERPRTTAFDVPDADRSFLDLGHDLDRDGTFDLVLRAESGFLVFPGRQSDMGKKLVSREPIVLPAAGPVEILHEVSVSTGRGVGFSRSDRTANAVVLDLDGDDPAEIVTVEQGGADAGGTLSWVRLARQAGAPR
jgi:hypothetical protein